MTHPSQVLKIAVVGCSCRAAVACLRRSGIEALAADQFADADLRELAPATQLARYPDDIPDWLAATDATHWMYVGGLENHPEIVAAAAEIRPLLGVPSPALPAIRDPLLLQETLRSAGFLFPETSLQPPHAGHWLIKPRRSAGGLQIRSFQHPTADEEVVYQRLLTGRSYGAAFAATNAQAQFLGASRQLFGRKWGAPQPFQYAGSIGPISLSPSHADALQSLADHLVVSTELRGLFGVDFLQHGDQLWPLEINPRFTAAMELLPVDVMRRHLAAWLPEYDLDDESFDTRCPRGKLFVYAPCDFVWTERMAGAVRRALNELLLDLADIPLPNTPIPQSAPILTLLAAGSDVGGIAAQLRRGARKVRELAAAAN
ncbi:ATP-grasp domain-containing protein [Blastopirellula marina]|uniref:ATP-grasp domain-containing protein n=1 Tax=Blastopirellula marina TaxID=124 RepID=A0A2S8FTD8_9BACT|nr:ATP-grasp domain-containing protein [Blastopirellula marina]PQO35448.1 hypothetical protein C5Y98_13890 [Blastopirellula marina]PTL44088.1 hypothetical protein C5Y97_13900 [Blastopirellula marina]